MTDTSVVQLFVAGVIPGLIGAASMMGLAWVFAVRYGFPVEEAFQLRRVWVTFKEAFWALLVPIIILGGIFGGIVTATEGGALAVVAALFFGLVVYRDLEEGGWYVH
jgi:C4-dicarboxylate transporter, DctM subunit